MNHSFRCIRPLSDNPNHLVYLCEDENGCPAVGKIIPLHLVSLYSLLQQHSCKGLAAVLDIQPLEGKALVFLEYIPGPTLADILKTRTLSKKQIRSVMSSLCQTVSELHRLKIVHRDIKPENIVVMGSEPYLIDFDISRMYSPEQKRDTRLMGTPGYSSPEQYGFAQSGPQSDIFSLGKVLEVMDTEHRFDFIIKKACSLDPRNRFKNASDMEKSIRGVPYVIPGWNNPSYISRIFSLLWILLTALLAVSIPPEDMEDTFCPVFEYLTLLSILLLPLLVACNLDTFFLFPKGKHLFIRILYGTAATILLMFAAVVLFVVLDTAAAMILA